MPNSSSRLYSLGTLFSQKSLTNSLDLPVLLAASVQTASSRTSLSTSSPANASNTILIDLLI
nr:MAG TPA: hypothetical protein [Caudoviricetes sp.]